MANRTQPTGFTIVEIMVVVVVTSILVSVAVIGYGGAQEQSREGRIQADIRNLSEAIQVARARTGKTLQGITGSYWTGHDCMFQSADQSVKIPDGTDFSQRTALTQPCWDDYLSAMQKISDASGTDVTDLLDPWGRPYYIDENDYIGGPCNKDVLGWLSHPYKGGYAQNWPENIASYDEVCTPR